jgi:hypothetical protein
MDLQWRLPQYLINEEHNSPFTNNGQGVTPAKSAADYSTQLQHISVARTLLTTRTSSVYYLQQWDNNSINCVKLTLP